VARRALLRSLGDVGVRLIRIFIAVTECGGFAASESELNIGRLTISKHIADLDPPNVVEARVNDGTLDIAIVPVHRQSTLLKKGTVKPGIPAETSYTGTFAAIPRKKPDRIAKPLNF